MSDLLFIFYTSLIVSIGAVIAFLFFQKSKKREEQANISKDLERRITDLLQEALKSIRQEIEETREKSSQLMQTQLKESSTIVKNVTEKLVRLDETNKQVIGFAEQLQSLENILTNPKQRGILGEYYLEELLQNVFAPNQYQMQYKFKDGQIVDAVIFAKKGIIPIDSKFSLENYNRLEKEKNPSEKIILERSFRQDLKKRIEETAKYIRPEEGTLDFAFMFIPAERIYYDLLVNKVGTVKVNTRSLLEYAVRDKHVHIVSPTSFYAYLQTILQGWRAFQIEESAKEIEKGVELLGRHIRAYDEHMRRLGGHIDTVCKTYNTAYRELGKIDKDVVKISGGKRTIKPLETGKSELNN